ncbi:MAG: hypothetical protein QOF51_980 [Chloroflexota bacterium]|nr:hypothetical protein [Chloroflexota bacterium]
MERTGVACLVAPTLPSGTPARDGNGAYLLGFVPRESWGVGVLMTAGESSVSLEAPTDAVQAELWFDDVQPAHGGIAQTIVDLLRSKGISSGHVGLTDLGDEQGLATATIRVLTARLPGVEWVPFSDQLRAIRAIKSPEELALLSGAAQALERSFDRVAELARPRASELTTWAAAVAEQVRLGCDPPLRARWGSGARPELLARPTHGTLARGMMILTDFEAILGGYGARGSQAFAVEACDPIYVDLFAWTVELWRHLFERIRPGVVVADLQRAAETLASELMPTNSHFASPAASVSLDGCGLGDDAPSSGALPDEPLAPGMVFALDVELRVVGAGRPYRAAWADPVTITATGAARLGTREPSLRIIGGG